MRKSITCPFMMVFLLTVASGCASRIAHTGGLGYGAEINTIAEESVPDRGLEAAKVVSIILKLKTPDPEKTVAKKPLSEEDFTKLGAAIRDKLSKSGFSLVSDSPGAFVVTVSVSSGTGLLLISPLWFISGHIEIRKGEQVYYKGKVDGARSIFASQEAMLGAVATTVVDTIKILITERTEKGTVVLAH